jgi:hypothetical protein
MFPSLIGLHGSYQPKLVGVVIPFSSQKRVTINPSSSILMPTVLGEVKLRFAI